jgi:hypothetical protein
MSTASDLATISSIVTQVDELTRRVTDLAERYGETPDSAVASELFTTERALTTARRSLDRGFLGDGSDLERGGTYAGEDAHVAARAARDAHLAAVLDEAQRQQPPFVGRHDRVEVAFDLHCVGLVRQFQQIGQPRDVRVDGKTGLAEPH